MWRLTQALLWEQLLKMRSISLILFLGHSSKIFYFDDPKELYIPLYIDYIALAILFSRNAIRAQVVRCAAYYIAC